MRVTRRRLKLLAAWQTFKMLPTLVKLGYYQFFNALMAAWEKNPNIKWSKR